MPDSSPRARELAKEIMRSTKSKPPGTTKLDVGWFLATFIALGLFVAAPKLVLAAPRLSRILTIVVLVLMAGLIYPIVRNLSFIRKRSWQRSWSIGLMALAWTAIILFGIFVWPPLPYYRKLDQKEIALFNGSLGRPPFGAEQIRLGCPQANEEVCVMAGQFLPLFQRARWKVEGNSVQRLILPKPISGVAIFRHGEGTNDPSNPDSGLWILQSQGLLQLKKAFSSLDMTPETAADARMPDEVLGIYFGPAP